MTQSWVLRLVGVVLFFFTSLSLYRQLNTLLCDTINRCVWANISSSPVESIHLLYWLLEHTIYRAQTMSWNKIQVSHRIYQPNTTTTTPSRNRLGSLIMKSTRSTSIWYRIGITDVMRNTIQIPLSISIKYIYAGAILISHSYIYMCWAVRAALNNTASQCTSQCVSASVYRQKSVSASQRTVYITYVRNQWTLKSHTNCLYIEIDRER